MRVAPPLVSPLLVDAFELLHPLGAGGMGRVYAARHRQSGEPAAIKVLAAERAHHPLWRRAFQDELRAVASLHHPAVVRLFDCGELPETLVDAAGCALPAGSQWLAMELVSGGVLDPAVVRPWSELLDLAREILGALACVHAHGIVHRDLKPGNVLLAGRDDERARVRLTDFGMAWQRGRAPEDIGISGGTPTYMAPEQWRNDVASFGPATDMYALGGLVWALVCGAPPHDSRVTVELARAHQWLPLPALAPRIPVPGGLAQWLATCLATDPAARFASAADARSALGELGAATSTSILTPARPGSTTDALTIDLGAVDLPSAPSSATGVLVRHAVPEVAPETHGGIPWPLVGIGLRLFAFRAVPLAGRRAERTRLWDALREVDGTGAPRAVALVGESGLGKTRLARWLGTRAEEIGVARWMPLHAGAGALLRQVGGFADDPALVALAEGGPLVDAAPMVRWIVARAAQRPVILWVDDVHDAPDALRIAADVVRTEAAVLVVLGVRPSAGVEPPFAADPIELAPLGASEMEALVRELLRMEGDPAGQVMAHARGSPGMAVALVEELLRRGALVPGTAGFLLTGPVRLPDPLFAAGIVVADALVDNLPAVELAATLGLHVEREVLCIALAHAGVASELDPPGRLLAAHRVRREPGGWSFTDPVLHAALLRRADEEGRMPAWHRACAEALIAAGAAPARIGRHLLAGGAPARAVGPLLVAARQAQSQSRFREMAALLAEREQALDQIGAPEDDPARGEGWARIMWAHLALGSPARAAEVEARILVHQDTPGWAGAIGLCHYVANVAARKRGDLASARRRAEQALPYLRDAGDVQLELRAMQAIVLISLTTGDLESAQILSRAALARAEALPDPVSAVWVFHVAGVVCLRSGDLDGAEQLYQRQLRLCDGTGRRNGRVLAFNGLGEVARARGDLEAARAWYLASDEVSREIGMDWVEIAPINLGIIEVLRGRPEEARVWLNGVANVARRLGQGRELQITCAVLLACDALVGDAERFREHLVEVEPGVTTGALGEPDIPLVLGIAAKAAAERGDAEQVAVLQRLIERIGVR